MVRPPRLQRATGHLKPLGRLTLGEALGVQVAIRRRQVSAFEALPALVTLLVALVLLLDDRSHSDLLVPSFALVGVMAQDGEVACWFQPEWCRLADRLGRSASPSGRRGDRGLASCQGI